jgi:integrative and conjugative element protein (TIGR02256 family)
MLEVSEECVRALEGYRQLEHTSPESGGVLLGRIIPPEDDLIVDLAAPPDQRDRRSRTYFFRRRKAAQDLVTTYWKMSNGATNYLGEWHTHPESTPTPSCIDKKSWRRTTRKARYHTPVLVFLIVGTKDVGVWEMGMNDRSPWPAERVE